MTVQTLVREALSRIPEPYSEDITDEVLGVIQNDEGLMRLYRQTAEGYRGTTRTLNQRIGMRVRRVTDRRLNGESRCSHNTLATRYTKLIP